MSTISKYTIFYFDYNGLITIDRINKLPHGKGITPSKSSHDNIDTPVWSAQGGYAYKHNRWFKIVLTGSKLEQKWRDKFLVVNEVRE